MPKPLAEIVEDARVASLQRFWTLPPAERAGLSRLSQEVASSLGATQAAVAFVDATRVRLGGAFGFTRQEFERQSSFCDTVVRSGKPLLVEDGSADARFQLHEVVRGVDRLRSYAGAPLLDRGGYTLGTVAVYSPIPGRFSPTTVDHVAALAELVREFLADHDGRSWVAVAPPVTIVDGWLGVKAVRAKAGERGFSRGLLIVSVARRSPAEHAGLRPTDLLHSIDGRVVNDLGDVSAALAGQVLGAHVAVTFRSAGQWRQCEVEVRPKRRGLSHRR